MAHRRVVLYDIVIEKEKALVRKDEGLAVWRENNHKIDFTGTGFTCYTE